MAADEDDRVDDDAELADVDDTEEDEFADADGDDEVETDLEEFEDDADGDGDVEEEDIDAVVELSSKEQSARSLEIRRAIEERMEERQFHEDIDYLDYDIDE